ncbi:MAG: glycosyltransferase family 2 protein [Candidatus Diapherotrites archaeon]
MKLVVMIPAYNEENSLPLVIKEIPRKIEGIAKVEVLVIDDGCSDKTVEVALKAGADRIIHHTRNKGLAPSFSDGLEEALRMGADIIVNTDADFQYNQAEIPRIIKPIMDKKADIVLTDRNVSSLPHMPFGKKLGNALSSWVTRRVSGFPVHDAQSGYRAFSKEAALKLNVLADYTYVQETIIQANYKKLKIVQVPCEFRKRQGKSRLIANIFNYAKRAGMTIITTYTQYKPLKVFLAIGGTLFLLGLMLGLTVIRNYLTTGQVSPHLPTAILSGFLIIIGFQVALLGIIADTIKANRMVQEQILYKMKKHEIDEINYSRE